METNTVFTAANAREFAEEREKQKFEENLVKYRRNLQEVENRIKNHLSSDHTNTCIYIDWIFRTQNDEETFQFIDLLHMLGYTTNYNRGDSFFKTLAQVTPISIRIEW